MSNNIVYKFKETEDHRWGIYLQDRLLATVGNFEACQSIAQFLDNNNMSHLFAREKK